jgi:UDP-N-acetylmuramoyl-L-alanyl-D-glutamate--2,6-diaminopimelate ligase
LITGATVDSREVMPGDLFGAFPGLKVHGATFATQAAAAGASAILTDAEGAQVVATLAPELPVLVAADARVAMGEAAALIYGDPSRSLVFLGITGTNGKTTTSYFIDNALAQVHERRGILGTVELRVRDEAIESPRTTVEAPVLHGLLARMLEEGVTAAVTEVSSHAAALDRISGVDFAVAVFTNLQWDHLDFHVTMERYLADKAKLFAPGRSRRGVVCIDDQYGQQLAREALIPVETVSTRPGSPAGDWNVEDADVGLDGVGSRFTLIDPQGGRHAAESPLPGLVNVSNAAVAIVAAHAAGVPLDAAIAGVAKAHAVPGRMERVVERSDVDPLAIVDYAHTPDALTLALQGVRPITSGKLILIFGSDGDRDQGKRPVMGEIAARLADIIVLTDENPRSEEPAAIRAAIREGIVRVRPDLRDVHEIEPRVAAVEYGLRLGGPGDTVMVTGKGHEPTQEIAGVFHRYNDRDAYLAAQARIEAERAGTT